MNRQSFFTFLFLKIGNNRDMLIFLFAALLLIGIFGALKNLRKKYYKDVALNERSPDFERKIRELAKVLSTPEPAGKGFDVAPVKSKIKKGYKVISKKVRGKRELYSFEKWLYENNAIFVETFMKNDFDFSRLPHNGEPRALIFARACVALTYGNVTKEYFEKAFDAFNEITPFTFSECERMSEALTVALLEKIAAVEEKSAYLQKMERLSSASERIVKKYVKNNVFLHFVKKNNEKNYIKIKKLLSASAKTCDDLEVVFDAFVAENDMLTENLMKSLIAVESTVCNLYERLSVYAVASKDKVFSYSDETTKKACLEKIGKLSDGINLTESEYAERVMKYSGNGLIGGVFSGDFGLYESVKQDKNVTIVKKKIDKTACYILAFSVILMGISAGIYFAVGNFVFGISAAILSVFALCKVAYRLTNGLFSLFLKDTPVFARNFEKIPKEFSVDVVVPVFIASEKDVSAAVSHLNRLYFANRDENATFTLLIDLKRSKTETDESDAAVLSALNEKLPPYLRAAVRKRVKRGDCFMGRERKRGAVEDYANFLYSGCDKDFSRLFNFDGFEKPKYFITLDADSVLQPKGVLRAVNVFSHEENEKYDLLAFDGKTNAFSLKTAYARLFHGGDGYEIYPAYSNLFYNLTGKSIFTGKGIFNLERYVEKLSGALPENRILSHDIIEGAILNTGASGVPVYEDAPLCFSSDENRRLRWKRGDVQLLPFVNFTNPKDNNKKIDKFYKFLMVFNGISVLSAPCFLALFILSFLSASPTFFSLIIAAFFINTVFVGVTGFFDVFVNLSISAYVKRVAKEFIKDFFGLVMLPYFAVVDLYVFAVSVVRSLTKKNLLLWKPFFAGRVREKKKRKIKGADYLLSHAKLMYKYFTSGKNPLVPDNFTVLPKGDYQNYTSPTNIGFSILSDVSASILEITDYETAKNRVKNTLDTALSLEKFKGHLFNWYDVNTKSPLEPCFVSSVDSANFITALIVAREYFSGDIKRAVDEYLKTVDFSALYDKSRDLFYIGYDKRKNTFSGHYDNVVSESRLLSYLGVCFGMPPASWEKLSRKFARNLGNYLLSYSGTTFEYKMPDLFLDVPKGGLFDKTSKIAAKIIKNTKKCGIFGISESGYFDLDAANNFRYYAFGVKEISVRGEETSCVFSPYSTYLLMENLKGKAIKNLKRFEKFEMLGDFGLYEALDARGAIRIVPEFMAHHLGMSMVAVANYLKDGAVKKLFSNADVVKSAEILLSEKQNESKVKNVRRTKFSKGDDFSDFSRGITPGAFPFSAILSGSDYAVTISDGGEGYSTWRGVIVNRFSKNIDDVSGGFFFVTDENGKTITPTFAPFYENKEYKTTFETGKVRFENASDNVIAEVYAPYVFSGEVRRLYIKNDGEETKKYHVVFYEDLALNFANNFASHPVFSNLFVETAKIDNNFVATRKGGKGENDMCFVMRATGADFSYAGNRYEFLGRGNTVKNPSGLLKKKYDLPFGAVLDPAAIAFADVEVPPFSTKEIDVFIVLKDDVKSALDEMRKTETPSFFTLIENSKRKNDLGKRFSETLSGLIPRLLYEPFSNEKILKICRHNELFMKYSENFSKKPLLFIYDNNKNDLIGAVKVVNALKNAEIGVTLVVAYRDFDGYYEKTKNEITEATSGLFGVSVFLDDTTDFSVLSDICFSDFSKEFFENAVVVNPKITQMFPRRENEILLKTGEGGFSNDSYEVEPVKDRTLLPYSNVVAGKVGGFISSDGGGGYTYYGNSRESKLTVWRNDFTSDVPSERALLFSDGDIFDMKRGAAVSFKKGESRYFGENEKFLSGVSEYIVDDGGAKIVEIEISAKEKICGKVGLYLATCLGAARENDFLFFKTEDGIREVVNVKNGISAYLKTFSGLYEDEFFGFSRGGEVPSTAMNNRSFSGFYEVNLNAGECEKYYFVFGGDYKSVVEATKENIEEKKNVSLAYFENVCPFSVKTSDDSFDVLFKTLPYQILSSRVNGKTAFYQAGGATGFRDMAQDTLSLAYFDKRRAREELMKLCNHVYFEGDVMHWWHGEKHGVRTRISDDGLFLAYAVANYVKISGDRQILDETAAYLDSPCLAATEESRFEIPKYYEKRESVLMHLERIIERAYDVGENGLLKIRGGDWNDALNAVGTDSAGESVWLSEFYIAVLKEMSAFYDSREKTLFSERIKSLEKAVLAAYENGRFKRLVTASGEWLGDGKSDVLKIDAISEAWAALSGISDKNKVDTALTTAKKCLFDKKNGLFLLLAPPFDDKKYYGYISLYPKGVRENGGQYTHGAIWFILALIECGRADEAYEIFKAINPVEKCKDETMVKKYMAEPYVLAADVSSCENLGRAGWTWYTGSASWCFKTMLEGFLGVSVKDGNIVIDPAPPKALSTYDVIYDDKKSKYIFHFAPSDKYSVVENGVDLGAVNAFPIKPDENREFFVKYEESRKILAIKNTI